VESVNDDNSEHQPTRKELEDELLRLDSWTLIQEASLNYDLANMRVRMDRYEREVKRRRVVRKMLEQLSSEEEGT